MATFQITGPDGKKYKVTGETAEGALAALKKSQANVRGDTAGSSVEAALIGARQGVTFGFGDEINAGVRAAGDFIGGKPFGESYDARLEHERALLDQTRAENPVASIAGEVGGAMLLPGAAIKGGASLARNVVRGAAIGGGQGAAYGFGDAEGGAQARFENAAKVGAIGATAGAAVPYALSGVQKALDGRAVSKVSNAAAKAAPTDDALRLEAKTLFDSAKARGVRVRESAFTPLTDDIVAAAREFGTDPAITPGALAAVDRITKLTGDVDWRDIETARRVAANAARNAKPGSPDQALSRALANKVDEFVFNLVDGDLTGGAAAGLGKDLKEARAIWSRVKNSETITSAIDLASVAKSGFENGLRNEFIRLRKDAKFFKGLSKAEQSAIEKVIRGTNTGFILRLVGKFSFGQGQQSGLIGGTLGSGGAYAVGSSIGGPVGGALAIGAQQATSKAALQGSENVTRGLASRAEALARAGGVSALPAPVQTPLLENALRRGARAPGVLSSN